MPRSFDNGERSIELEHDGHKLKKPFYGVDRPTEQEPRVNYPRFLLQKCNRDAPSICAIAMLGFAKRLWPK